MVKATKPSQTNSAGGFVQKEAGLHVSKVGLASPKNGKASRVRIESRNGKNIRVAVKCGSELGK